MKSARPVRKRCFDEYSSMKKLIPAAFVAACAYVVVLFIAGDGEKSVGEVTVTKPAEIVSEPVAPVADSGSGAVFSIALNPSFAE